MTTTRTDSAYHARQTRMDPRLKRGFAGRFHDLNTHRQAWRTRLVCLALLLTSLLASGTALARCALLAVAPDILTTGALPSLVTLNHAAIGQVMYTQDLYFATTADWVCMGDSDARWSMSSVTDMPLAEGFDKVYRTSVPGVGVRFSFSTANGMLLDPRAVPFNSGSASSGGTASIMSTARMLRIEYIRIASGVAQGTTTLNFHSIYTFPPDINRQTRYQIPQTTVTITNNLYFSSCVSNTPQLDVKMGKSITSLIQQGQSPSHDFSFEVDCSGMLSTPNSVPQVKAYFQGNSTGPGLLTLDDPATRASNVAIELKTSAGAPLPFNQTQATPLAWQGRKAGDIERYLFSGKARYIAHGGPVGPGSGDATLTYVLQYN